MTTILFPHQLFIEALTTASDFLLVEDPLFFKQVPFHKQKLIFHHVSMRSFRDLALSKGHICEIVHLEELEKNSLLEILIKKNNKELIFYETRDDFLSRNIQEIGQHIKSSIKPSPSFLTPIEEGLEWQKGKKVLRMHDFYQWQRKRLNILVEGSAPVGGKWSFDTENRKAIPKGVATPQSYLPDFSPQEKKYIKEAQARFSQEIGSEDFKYPINHSQALASLEHFIQNKLKNFGDYEDAVRKNDPVLFHSQLSPLLNSGLLTPQQILTAVLKNAEEKNVPLNSLEGFIRQLIGWREFMSLSYLTHGRKMRTSNVLKHSNSLPRCFWEGKTGIVPIDETIQSVIQTGYAHHIERLMILGVFMLLTETKPIEAFKWFFSMFIDAYDWVMVPNVYAMSQYADGGGLTTKPYICGSAYLRKMTDFPKGEWCSIWDGLYWRWVSRHQALLEKNPRTKMSVSMWKKFSAEKQKKLIETAESFLTDYFAR